MIELFAHGSPNPHKVSIALEELGLAYKVTSLNPYAGEGSNPEYLTLNPNGKVPTIIDHDTGITVYESNAILLYLAEKTGQLIPKDPAGKWEAIKWLFFQAACVGPMYGQRAHFSLFAPEKIPYGIKRYEDEGDRLSGVIEARLASRDYFLDDYSIVDIAHFGWAHCAMAQGYGLNGFPAYKRWYERVAARPAVQKGVTIPGELPDMSTFVEALKQFKM
jgi:GSH-dependent disulfide-bond oxidoreductase